MGRTPNIRNTEVPPSSPPRARGENVLDPELLALHELASARAWGEPLPCSPAAQAATGEAIGRHDDAQVDGEGEGVEGRLAPG